MNQPISRPDTASDNSAPRSSRLASQSFAHRRAPREADGATGAPSDGALDISVRDWDVLFGAIQTKLMLSVDGICAQPACPLNQAVGRLHVTVLECVAAMDLLHAALSHERGLSRSTQTQEALFYAQWLRGDSSHRFHQ